MILINEFLPDPQGADATGEWIELWNNGNTSASLVGWRLENKAGKKFVFKNEEVARDAYLLVPRTNTKLTLKNSDETISLYDPAGKLVDQAFFRGTAQSGKSFNRIEVSG